MSCVALSYLCDCDGCRMLMWLEMWAWIGWQVDRVAHGLKVRRPTATRAR